MAKSGADAISVAVKHICGTIKRYNSKLHAIIDAAESAGFISAGEAELAHAFVSAANTTCFIWERIADFNSVTP